jgi:uncharacterized protein YndB with AHSA1/START domain
MPLLALCALTCALPQAPERHGQDTLVLPASIEATWAAFTDARAIERALGVKDAKVELRPGGRIEWSAQDGSTGSAALWPSRRLLAHERGAMLAVSLVPPSSEPEWVLQRAGQQWSVLYLAPLAHDRTELTLTTLAQGEGADLGLAMERYAGAARSWVEAIAASFEASEATGSSMLAQTAVQEWCGGEWTHESRASDGATVRERVVLASILGGAFVEESVWSGGVEGLTLQSRSIYGLDPRSRDMRCWTWSVHGVPSEATLRYEEDAILLRGASPADTDSILRVRRESVDAHAVEMLVDGKWVISKRYARVPQLPIDWKLLPSIHSAGGAGLRSLQHGEPAPELQRTTGVVGASCDVVWSELSSSEGLVRLWGVAKGSIDLRLGGAILTHYDAQGELGDPRGIRHEILAFDPGRMLAFRTQPPANAAEFLRTWTAHGWHVLRLDERGPDRAQLTTTGCDYRAEDSEARDFFERGNAFVQKGIEARYPPSADGREALRRLAPLVGATYEALGTVPTGETVRARTVWSSWCGPIFAWQGQLALGEDAELDDHTWMLYGPGPSESANFWKFGADGSVARGSLVPDGESGVGHDWKSWARDGQARHIYVQLVPDDRDYHYRAQPRRTEATTLVSLDYVRR